MKFKELRGFIFSFILIILNIVLFMYSFYLQDKMKMIISLLIAPIILIITFSKFYIRVLDGVMLVYHFVGPIAIPTIIDYQEIQSIKLMSNTKIQIKTSTKKYNIYIFKANERISLIQNKVEEVKHEKN